MVEGLKFSWLQFSGTFGFSPNKRRPEAVLVVLCAALSLFLAAPLENLRNGEC